jgi:hypothetical protein
MEKLFISLIGLEERVLGSFEEGIPEADDHFVFINKEIQNESCVKLYSKEIFGKYLKGKNYKILQSSYFNPLVLIGEFNRAIRGHFWDQSSTRITLDVSTFNRQNLLVILYLLRKVYKFKNVDIIYSVPKKINPKLSKGASGFSNIPFFGGDFSIQKKKLLILLLGYEIDRPIFLWRELEPSKTILVRGIEPILVRADSPENDTFIELTKQGECEVVEISISDISKAKEQLSILIEKNVDVYNIVISPLNTKLQVIALYLVWEMFPQMQITVAFPDRFDDWLTKGFVLPTKKFLLPEF